MALKTRPRAAEKAGSADHGGRDGVHQQGSATGADRHSELSRGADDAAPAGNGGDKGEHGDPDCRHGNAGTTGRFGIATGWQRCAVPSSSFQ